MNRRSAIKHTGIFTLGVILTPSISLFQACKKRQPIPKDHEMIDKLFAHILSYKLIDRPDINGPLLIKMIKDFPTPTKITANVVGAQFRFADYQEYPEYDNALLTKRNFEACHKFYINGDLFLQQAEAARMGMEGLDFVLGIGNFEPISATAFSIFSTAFTYGMDHYIENREGELTKSPFYMHNMNECIFQRAFIQASKDEQYQGKIIKIDTNLLGTNKENYIKKELPKTTGSVLKQIAGSADKTILYEEIEARYKDVSQQLEVVRGFYDQQLLSQQRQSMKQKAIDDLNYELRELRGTADVVGFVLGDILNDSSVGDFKRGSGAIIDLYQATSEYLLDPKKVGVMALGGSYVASFSVLGSVLGGGENVSNMIMQNLQMIHQSIIGMRHQLSRIEANQAIILNALNTLLDKFRLQSYQINDSLATIESAVFAGIDYAITSDRDQSRYKMISIQDEYKVMLVDGTRRNKDWITSYKKGILGKIYDYAKNESKLQHFTGKNASVRTLVQIPAQVEVTGYLDLMIGGLAGMLSSAGVAAPYADLCNPYEWAYGANGYLEVRLANLDITVKEEKLSVTNLYAEGLKLRSFIARFINFQVAQQVKEKACNILGMALYDEFQKQYAEINRDRIFKNVSKILPAGPFHNVSLQKVGDEDPRKRLFMDINEIRCDTHAEEAIKIATNDSLLGLLCKTISNFEDQDKFGFKNYNISPYGLQYVASNDTVYRILGTWNFVKIENDPFTECIRRELIKKIPVSSYNEAAEYDQTTFNLIDPKTGSSIIPGISYVETYYTNGVNIGTVRAIMMPNEYGQPRLELFNTLIDYSFNRLRLDYHAKFKQGIATYLSVNLAGHQTINEANGALSLMKIMSGFAMWRNQERDSVPLLVEQTDDKYFKLGERIDERSKRNHYENVNSIDRVNQIFEILNLEINGYGKQLEIGTNEPKGSRKYSKSNFDDPKNTYKVDTLNCIISILNENQNYLMSFFRESPNTKSLPIVDHTLAKLQCFMKMQGIFFD